MIAVATALPLLALGLYLALRLAASARPAARRAPCKIPASDQNLEALVARVEARLREHPEEGEGWDVIAPVYMGWQRYQRCGRRLRSGDQAARANRRSVCRDRARRSCSPITGW